MNTLKKLYATLGFGLFSAGMALADSTAVEPIISTDDVTEIFTTCKTSMTSLIDAALPVIIAFVGGGLVIWGALALVSLMKRGLNAGKGR